MELSLLAFGLSIIFLLRSLEIIHAGQPVLNALICFFLLSIGFIFIPASVSRSFSNGFVWVALISASIFVVAESLIKLWRKIVALRVWRGHRSALISEEMQEVCKALEKMANQKVGALIVIEQKNSLSDLMNAGYQFDGEVKAEVITSFFDKSSALHDGAMLISKSRIKALKVILPLTTRADIPMGIGTRHRSAIGLTEKVDALALIVSEERGLISIAYQGVLRTAESFDQLIQLFFLATKGKSIAEIR